MTCTTSGFNSFALLNFLIFSVNDSCVPIGLQELDMDFLFSFFFFFFFL